MSFPEFDLYFNSKIYYIKFIFKLFFSLAPHVGGEFVVAITTTIILVKSQNIMLPQIPDNARIQETNPGPEIKLRIRIAGVPTEHLFSLKSYTGELNCN